MVKIKDFHSKRNKVSLVKIKKEKYIYKVHSKENSFNLEKNFYLKLQENKNNFINVPRLISYKDGSKTIFLQYVEGTTLLEELELLEEKNNKKAEMDSANLIIALYKWIEDFYKLDFVKKEKFYLNDINFRNFIIKDGEIYGIDFEDITKDRKREDIAEIIAFYLTYDPCFTNFKNSVIEKVIQYLTKEKKLKHKELNQNIKDELEKIQERRSKRKKWWLL
ncbi:hypothetical protein SH2C18_03670 [Clostridium sediminicola]|uniref:hypothetical protein n=1 Tax=Clostridium sediminicola TaxID=3114879 RepID=UPI0031F21991